MAGGWEDGGRMAFVLGEDEGVSGCEWMVPSGLSGDYWAMGCGRMDGKAVYRLRMFVWGEFVWGFV